MLSDTQASAHCSRQADCRCPHAITQTAELVSGVGRPLGTASRSPARMPVWSGRVWTCNASGYTAESADNISMRTTIRCSLTETPRSAGIQIVDGLSREFYQRSKDRHQVRGECASHVECCTHSREIQSSRCGLLVAQRWQTASLQLHRVSRGAQADRIVAAARANLKSEDAGRPCAASDPIRHPLRR
jgi:hypothetical protein